MLAQRREHAAGDADHVLHLGADEAEDGHVGDDADVAAVLELAAGLLEVAHGGAGGVDGHRDVHFGRGDEVDRDAVAVQDREDLGEEPVRDRPLVRVHVDDRDVVLDRHRRRPLRCLPQRRVRRPRPLDLLRRGHHRVRNDDGSVSSGVLHVLDPDLDGRFCLDDLVHR